MLRTLLQDMEGKTVWIDTSGTDYLAQAQLLMTQHPQVLRHAVLPLDATVTSVQKTIQNSSLNWSSLMLTKVDEAAYPWPLITGLSEQCCPVSCAAGSDRIDQPTEPFDAARLVQLALGPLLSYMSGVVDAGQRMASAPSTSRISGQSAFKPKLVSPVEVDSEERNLTSPKISKIKVSDAIEIPTLKGYLEQSTALREKAPSISSRKKISNG